ncbi:radical SAM family heme chaperone HemW [Hyphomicrobium facile]|uniref:Heme chaperone HemW n=1 Tax=Hyphomicrobium facile TaxID=51670 RepID=A0A1I7NTA7_9HYPH|nr:radical SAM family heme chaperone HemW [Hyphomicrobium facile]SFV37894.1 oxygen-independent coproporphyrinogen-3 oxidase [Hyphomicrobium facile]
MTDVDQTFGVYVHWPFCAQKCPYCDFNSHVRFGGWDEARFLAAYKREIDWVAERIGPRTVTSIFFGGGTPSLMQAHTVASIIEHIAKRWGVAPDAEITLEANPGSVEAGRFRGFREAGVNRVSIGVQSLRDQELRKLGRIHSVAEAKAALEIARGTFERFSFDLIYARPGQTAEAWRAELAEALDLAGDHLSLYQLTIEPDTPYAALHAAGKLIIPDDHDASALYEITEEMTGERGLAAYEVSNYARPGSESRHNLLYWRYGEYAGVGPGAHGRILIGNTRTATVAERNPEAWAARVEEAGHGFTEMTTLAREEQADEMLLMGLRLSEGIDLGRLAVLGGARPSRPVITELEDLGLLQSAVDRAPDTSGKSGNSGNWRRNELDEIVACAGPGLRPETGAPGPDRIRVTPQGRLVLNAVVAKLSKSFQSPERVDNLRSAG